MASVEPGGEPIREADLIPAYLIIDTESVPDGRLIAQVKYPDDNLSETAAIERAQQEARQFSSTGSDFLPVTFQYPIAICVANVGSDYRLQAITCLDAPHFRTRQIVADFWRGVARRSGASLVTFNGRGFDLPLLEFAAFRYGATLPDGYLQGRNRYKGYLDLHDWLTNFGACRLTGGLNLLSKLLGKPGKMGVAGDQVYSLYRAGKLQEINDYCLADTLDTYFVFLRTRVLVGLLTLAQEHEIVLAAKTWLTARADEVPALKKYLDNWGDWQPWP